MCPGPINFAPVSLYGSVVSENLTSRTPRRAEKRQADVGSPGKAANPADDIASWPIEKCFEELEKIVAALENQTTSLEDSLQLFERGMKLSQRCAKELSAIEHKIQVIVENAQGEAQIKEFSPAGGEA